MIDLKSMLTIYYDNNGIFTDYSHHLSNFSDRNTATITHISLEDSIYIGFYKPISSVYFAFKTANTASTSLVISYWNGSSWHELPHFDDTSAFKRDGLIQWNPPGNWAGKEVNNNEQFWIKIDLNNDSSEMKIKGINILYADDSELQREFPQILDSSLLAGQSSHVLIHEAVKNDLVQQLRQKSYYKIANSGTERLTPWDLLDIVEVRQYAIYSALAKIFNNASDNPQDHWAAKALYYQQMAGRSLDFAQVVLDQNDNGVAESFEKNSKRFNTSMER